MEDAHFKVDTSCVEDVTKQLQSARTELSPLLVDPALCTVTVEETEAAEEYTKQLNCC